VLDVKEYGISVHYGGQTNIVLAYAAGAFMTADDVREYVDNALPNSSIFTDLIAVHNADASAHPDLRNSLGDVRGRIQRLEDMLINDITGNSFIVEFTALDGVIAEGVYNQPLIRIEF
jgi:hypothetical protein